ncbi:MAG TPA: pyridine nucleotide-disulfide oxidoreductase [Betaproteobacteria bacterium]|jgi:dihydrolipoamide dehydrogenase|nr:pyridine nucleotide-disulfide oxidoreductase [Betaproteobacteria bacterium]
MKHTNPQKKWIGLIITTSIIALVFIVFRESILNLLTQLNLQSLKDNYSELQIYFRDHPVQLSLLYALIYITVTALSLPGAVIMTLAGGAIFGLVLGTILVSFCSTIGATAAFLITRYFFRNSVRARFGDKLKIINDGIKKDGAFYLLTLRLVPIFPFFAINVLMALTPIKTRTFYLASQLGMLLGTIIFVNAGTQLATINSTGDILSVNLIISLFVLGLFPIVAKIASDLMNRRRIYAKWSKPKHFDYNLIVIGGGAAGLVSSYVGAAVNARVALIEKHKMGGDCLNTGCVPSKALIKTAHFIEQAKNSKRLGIQKADITFNFSDVMKRVQKVIKKIEPHDSVDRYTELGVTCYQGNAKIISPWTISIEGEEGEKKISARSIIVASGASPIIPHLPNINEINHATSDTIWDLNDLPKRLIIIGGGAIGCELAQAFQRLGSEVILVESDNRILIKEDADVAEMIENQLSDEGVTVLTRHRAKGFVKEKSVQTLVCDSPNGEVQLAFDQVLFAIGRRANLKGYGLEDIDAISAEDIVLPTNDFLQTKFPNIYACGDVTGRMQFTHAAAHQAWHAAVNALFGRFKQFTIDFSSVPWATFTHPEVARVGLNEDEANKKNIAYEATIYGIDDLDRAIADSEDHGFIKVLTRPKSDQIIGVTIVSEHASEIIAEFVLAMKYKLGLNKILATTHIYPTFSEANKYVAGEWKRKNAPKKILKILEIYHRVLRR